jgi:hypothetical protein
MEDGGCGGDACVHVRCPAPFPQSSEKTQNSLYILTENYFDK